MVLLFVLVSLLLPGLITGCVGDRDVQALRADTSALERQSSERQQTVEARLQTLSDRVAQVGKSQEDTRRDLARTAATLDELRIQMQRLQGDIQETQHRARRGTNGETVSNTKLADFETRLAARQATVQGIQLYNYRRPHTALALSTPGSVHDDEKQI